MDKRAEDIAMGHRSNGSPNALANCYDGATILACSCVGSEIAFAKAVNAMEKTISLDDAPERLGDLLQDVSDRGDRYVVESGGVPMAVVVPISLYRHWQARRERFFAQMRETAERADLGEDEAIRLTNEAKRSVRTEP